MTASDWASGASLVEAVGIARLMGRRARPAALYPHARGSVLVPLALFGLPERSEADGAMWALKDEFYVTAVHTPWLAQRAGVSLERAWQELSAALEGRRAGPVRIGDELRIVRASSYARFARARSGWSSARRRSCRTAVPSSPPPTAEPVPPRAEERPEGLLYREEFISPEEEQQLLALLSSIEFRAVVMRGQAARRTVRHFGLDYDYESGDLVPADPLPDSMLWLRDRCAALMERDPADLVQILVSRYPPGAGIGWHRDAPMFGSRIAGVSLLAPCRMRFQRTVKGARSVAELELAPRSAYLLTGKARWSWQHSIPATKALRYSVTFRTLRRGS